MPQVFFLLLADILTTASAQILFKKGVSEIGDLDFSFFQAIHLIPKIFQNIWIISGMFLFGISFVLWLFIISKIQLNVAYPIALSSTAILTTLVAWGVFKEHLSLIQLSGIAVIILGIFLLLKS